MLIDSPTLMPIDIHQHLWPQPLIELLRRRTRPPRLEGGGDRPLLVLEREPGGPVDLAAHDPQRRLAALDAAGIDRALLSLSTPLGIEALPAAESAELIAAFHDGIADVVAGSGGRLGAWAAAPLAADDAGAATVASALDRGFAGAILPSEALASPQALERLAPVLDLLEQRGAPAFVHPGPAPGSAVYAGDGMPGWWPNLGAYPGLSIRAFFAWRALAAGRWPRLRICFAILGGAAPFLEERWRVFSGETRAIDPNLYLETASAGRLALECTMATYGIEQIVFGTDIPVIDPAPLQQALTALGPAAEGAVTEHNPRRLLGTEGGDDG
jgi:predicted TIM-barrel fold metal-dependent hydrolase